MKSPPLAREVRTLAEMLAPWRREGLRTGFVPTMGNLHAGHLDLVRAAAAAADRVVVSIFVNPLQFGPGEDFASYPRTLEDDLAMLAEEGCDVVFVPDEAELYPLGRDASTRVEVPGLSDILCGAFRPGHFRGVTTVVAKLFNLVQPQLAVFGAKDFQQLAIIRRMAADMAFPLEILAVPTRREPDGLAMSSRNRYLSPAERAVAPALYRALLGIAAAIESGDRDFVALQQSGVENVRSAGLAPEYFEIRAAGTLGVPRPEDRELVVLAAARLGRTRLIDNVCLALNETGRSGSNGERNIDTGAGPLERG